jgi:hypothetical protein
MQTSNRQELIEKAMDMYGFLKNYPDAPTDIIFLYVWYWSHSRTEMENDSVLSKFLYMWDFNHNLPKPLKDKHIKDIKAGIDCEKKIQALMKLYKD